MRGVQWRGRGGGGRRGKVKSEEIASSRELTEASETSQIGKGEECLKNGCDTLDAQVRKRSEDQDRRRRIQFSRGQQESMETSPSNPRVSKERRGGVARARSGTSRARAKFNVS